MEDSTHVEPGIVMLANENLDAELDYFVNFGNFPDNPMNVQNDDQQPISHNPVTMFEDAEGLAITNTSGG